MITHDLNSPFAQAAREATAETQAETVYAVKVTYSTGEVEYWNTRVVPQSDEAVFMLAQDVSRYERGKRTVMSARVASRTVTISATAWTETSE